MSGEAGGQVKSPQEFYLSLNEISGQLRGLSKSRRRNHEHDRQVVANSLLALGYLAMKPIELEVRLALIHKLTEIIEQAADGDVRLRALFYLRALERTENGREAARKARIRALQAARHSPDEQVRAWARIYLSEECENILQN